MVRLLQASFLLLLPGVLVAQREPVLRQIKVPHAYYYREMYLPQLTSGPSSVTWSPDGQELIYSMQGSLWRQLLNCGFRLPAGAGTDAMANFASLRGPVGMNRVFAKITGPLDHRGWLAALKAGRTFATNGPLLGFTLDGKELGSELAIGVDARELVARVTLNSIVPVDRLEIVRNGEVVMQIPLTGDRTRVSTTVRLPVQGSGWYLLRARGNGPEYPVLDFYPYATTSPIYVTVAGAPIRSTADADYFLAWIDRLAAAALLHKDWNTEQEKATALTAIREARAEFERRKAP